MAEVLISTLVTDVLRSLISVSEGPLWGFKKDLRTLKRQYDLIRAVLRDAEEKRSTNSAVELWLKQLRSVCIMIENELNEISTEALLLRLRKERGIYFMVSGFFSYDHNPLMFRARIARKMKSIRRKVDDLVNHRHQLSLIPDAVTDVEEIPFRQTTFHTHDSLLNTKRNQEVDKIIETIFNKDIGKHDNPNFLRVYGILGMGGVGKTTLARLVYNDVRVNDYFELKCWVDVSEFQVQEIMKAIIRGIDGSECTLTHLYMLQESLKDKLRQRRFLIVLDDIWIYDGEKWDLLRETLSCGTEGSIVLMTTRLQQACKMMAVVPELQHYIGCLSEEDSWLLFKEYAFAQGREGDDISALEPIGREIVAKCIGHPLAIKTLGISMWSRRSISDWLNVKKHFMQKLEGCFDVEYIVWSTFKLSYDNLHPHSKQCFLYCCLFPRGYDMEKDVVIQLWIANSFTPPSGDLYLLGENIFDDLVSRCFLEVVKNKNYTNVRYQVHHLMHHMARRLMADDCLAIEEARKDVIIPKNHEVFHLTSSYPAIQLSPEDSEMLTSLRSIFMFGEGYKFNISQFLHNEYLRVLYLRGIELKELPESICKLKFLKYLNLSYSSIEILPDSTILLQNLEVLLLNSCYQLYKLPKDMRYMIRLRLLDVTSCHSLLHLPKGIKELSNLQLVSQFRVGNKIEAEIGEDDLVGESEISELKNVGRLDEAKRVNIRRLSRFHVGIKIGTKIGDLVDVDDLEGELEISGLENVEDSEEAKCANLKCKRNLSVLKLCWSNIYMRESKREMHKCDEKVLEQLEPHSGLKELSIYFYMGKSISPSWMVNLTNLVEIGFSGCKLCECIPPLGKLLKLRIIKLLGMDSLEGFHNKDLSDDTDMFPSLQELNIFMCPNLVSLPRNLPKLEIAILEECGSLNSLPGENQGFKGLKQLEISGCKQLSQRYEMDKGVGWPNISHIPNIKIDNIQVTLEMKRKMKM